MVHLYFLYFYGQLSYLESEPPEEHGFPEREAFENMTRREQLAPTMLFLENQSLHRPDLEESNAM